MEQGPTNTLDPRARQVWFIQGILLGIILLLLPLAYTILNYLFWDLSWKWAFGGLALIFILTTVQACILPPIRMRIWRYDIKEEEVDIQHGLIIKKRTLIPMIRVQHVDTEHGPIMRHLGLATLLISTAGSQHRIPALDQERAAQLRGDISRLARMSDEDV